MKKILLVVSILILAASAFAYNPRQFNVMLKIADGDIMEYVNTPDSPTNHQPEFHVVVTDDTNGGTISTDTNTANIVRVVTNPGPTGTAAWLIFDAQGFPTTGNAIEGLQFTAVVTYLPNLDINTNSVTRTFTAPADSGPVFLWEGDDAWTFPANMFGAVEPEFSLTVNSNYDGAAIYIDGMDSGEITPFTFDPAVAGTYTVVMDYVTWTPEDYVYAAEADEMVNFMGVMTPDVPVIYDPAEGTVYEWDNPAEITIMWGPGQITPDSYEINWNDEGWVAYVSPVLEFVTPELDTGDYSFAVRGVIVDPAGAKSYTKARINSRSIVSNVASPKGTSDFAITNFSVIVTVVDYEIDPGVPAPIDPETDVTIVGGGFVGGNLITGGLTPVPNPTFVATSEGILQLFGTGIVTVTFDFDPAVEWFLYLDGGVWVVIEGPLSTYDVTVDLGAKDGGLEFKSGSGGMPTLPVELSSFSAVLTAQKFVELTWISESETNMLGYRVYRSETQIPSEAALITPVMIPATNTSSTQVYNLLDEEVSSGNTYYYWLEAADYGHSEMFGPQYVEIAADDTPELPVQSVMSNAYPNPFKANSNTNIDVSVKAGENGTVTIYNVLGQVVQTYKIGEGNHNLKWNGHDNRGNTCGSGIYFYKLSTPSKNQTKKMVIVK
ncbi:MAG: T9SS type A sorting domain-containing protein [Candidatus Cloacimonadaceae bacterium]